MSTLPLENPFAVNRLNAALDYVPDWDVPTINRSISEAMRNVILEVLKHRNPNPGLKIPVLLGPPGYGKTHLFGRISHELGREAFLVFVPQIENVQRSLAHLQWHFVEQLFSTGEDKVTRLARYLAQLCQFSFRSYFEWLTRNVSSAFEEWCTRLEKDADLVLLELLSHVPQVEPFLKLAESMARKLPTLSAPVLRALVLGCSPAQHEARSWLRGESLIETEATRLHLAVEPPPAQQVFKVVGVLLQRLRIPCVLCLDQLDHLVGNVEATSRLTSELLLLLQEVPNLVISLSCMKASWPTFRDDAHKAFPDRVTLFQLDTLNSASAIELLSRRLQGWKNRRPDLGPTWPFKPAAVESFVQKTPAAPRGFIDICANRFAAWAAKGVPADWILLDGEPPPPPPPDQLFLQEWNQTLASLQKEGLSPTNVAVDRLYRSVREALALAREGKMKIGEASILALQPGATRSKANDLSVRVGVGSTAFEVIVAVSKETGGVGFGHYIQALEGFCKPPVAGVVLLRPAQAITFVATAKARKAHDQMVHQKKLRPFALQDQRATFERLECLLRLLDRAGNDLLLGGKLISLAECRQFILKTRVLENFLLFEVVCSGWGATPTVPVSTSEPAAKIPTPAAPVTPASPPSKPVAATATKPVAVSLPAATRTSDSSGHDQGAWVQELLGKIVNKLHDFGQPVEPLKYEIGPTFARLQVFPQGKTDVARVQRYAENLKVNLALTSTPLIAAGAGYISIDVQLPVRQVVTLTSALQTSPATLGTRPAFPVGKDVAGQTHWLDLSDSATCHLLVAGATGSGKSEFLKMMLAALASRLSPQELQFVLIDPKRVTFNFRGETPYLAHPVARTLDEAMPRVQYCVEQTLERYKLLEERRVENVSELKGQDALPRIVLVIDEFADLMADKAMARELEGHLKRISALARAAGVHLILATQRPEAGVVTPLLKANLPSAICFRVASERNSKLILDQPEAAYLLGKGDLLWRCGGGYQRLQCPLVGKEELEQCLRI